MTTGKRIGDAIRFVSTKVKKAAYGKVTKIQKARSPKQITFENKMFIDGLWECYKF